jgi:parvulin-like peptidyl-prolyl isomerase
MSMFPLAATLRSDQLQAEQAQQVEAAPGEVALDAIVRAQSLQPQVARMITLLQNALFRAAEELAKKDPQNPAIEQAKLALQGVAEIFTA